LWLVPGLAIAIVANQLGNANGVGILVLIGFGIAPDVPRPFGSRGRPIHNVLHQPALAIAALIVAATGVVPVVWLVGSLVWLGQKSMPPCLGEAGSRTGESSDDRGNAPGATIGYE
jgi:hypothetical protein